VPSKYLTWDDDCALRYLHAGPTTPPDVLPGWDRGAPIVFVHGEGGNAAHFLPQIEFFGQDHSPMALDLVGHGRSTGLSGPGGIDAAADMLLDALGRLRLPPAVLVGHGAGGHIVLRAAAVDPAAARAVVTLGTGWESEWPAAEATKLEDVVDGQTGQFFDTPFFAPETSPETRRAFWGALVQTDPRVRLEDIRDYQSSRLEDRLPPRDLPTRVLRGASDALCSTESAEKLATAMGSAVTEVPGAGHVPQLENPQAVQQAILEVCG
jgi:pimeloyl-ACP methyl ester carboxylesterase